MMSSILSENLKKYRMARNMTQEQAAEALLINAQTISRWECGTTLPDALTLPRLAELYAVTIDDFYKKQSIAYENYSQRLAALYETTRNPDDFIRCEKEYKKMMRSQPLSIADKWNYATIHHFMMRHCMETAIKWYDETLKSDPVFNPQIHRRARSLRIKLFFEIGKGNEMIQIQESLINEKPDDLFEWCFLIETYLVAKQYSEAYSVFEKAVKRFPDMWELFIHGGEAKMALGEYEEALLHFETAGKIGTHFYDDLYCKADCLGRMGNHKAACDTYLEIMHKLQENGYDAEADAAHLLLEKAKAKI